MPSRSGHLLSLTSECISVARLASVSIMNSAHSATEGELAVPATISGTLRRLRAGTSTASNPTPILVTTSMSLGGLELGLAKAGAAEGDAMHRRMLLQLGVEIRLRDHVGKFDEIDVVARVKQRSSLLRHQFRDEDFLLVGRHFLPLVLALRVVKGRRRSPRLAGAYY